MEHKMDCMVIVIATGQWYARKTYNYFGKERYHVTFIGEFLYGKALQLVFLCGPDSPMCVRVLWQQG